SEVLVAYLVVPDFLAVVLVESLGVPDFLAVVLVESLAVPDFLAVVLVDFLVVVPQISQVLRMLQLGYRVECLIQVTTLSMRLRFRSSYRTERPCRLVRRFYFNEIYLQRARFIGWCILGDWGLSSSQFQAMVVR
ncbi:MAG: hypothetical protein VX738_14535, partial [Planctomycetota bacterium]|nr:hypothetical protein [Planctomycetota bacterium]